MEDETIYTYDQTKNPRALREELEAYKAAA